MSWQSDLLAAWGAPDTPQNESFLSAWSQAEGANSYNNPLNITSSNPYWGGSTGAFNTFGPGLHVLEFPSLSAGVAATTKWLDNGYTDVLAAFKSGNPNQYFADNPSAAASFGEGWAYGVGHVEALQGSTPPVAQLPAQYSQYTGQGRLFGIPGTGINEGIGPAVNGPPGSLSSTLPSWLEAILVPLSEWWKVHPIGLLLVALFVTIIGIAFIMTDKNVSGAIATGGKAAALG